VLACWALQWVTLQLSELRYLDANIVLGAVLMVAVLLLPKGLLPTAHGLLDRVLARRRQLSARVARVAAE
jgi:branched-chain amino acid transport system permease protein